MLAAVAVEHSNKQAAQAAQAAAAQVGISLLGRVLLDQLIQVPAAVAVERLGLLTAQAARQVVRVL
jgi:hypothetical protein